MVNDRKLMTIMDYYRNKNLLLVGLNDSQGVNLSSPFLKNGLLEHIADLLYNHNLSLEVIDAFSLMMNKTEHVDYILKNNLSKEEIRLSQIYSAVCALKNDAEKKHLPNFLGNIGYLSKFIYRTNLDDDKVRISTAISDAYEPLIIYSSGVNNLMRSVGSDLISIQQDYIDRHKKPNYNYTLSKSRNKDILLNVINGVKKNFENILSLNSGADIYVLGAYIPDALKKKEFSPFADLIYIYNGQLNELCAEYGLSLIQTDNILRGYNKKRRNFHITSRGHEVLAESIINHIYFNKISPTSMYPKTAVFEVDGLGSRGMKDLLSLDYNLAMEKASQLTGYEKQRALDIALEHKNEIEIFEKVLTYTKR